MRSTFAALTFLLVLMTPGKSQGVNDEQAALDCAAIAEVAAFYDFNDPRWREERDRLFAYWYGIAKAQWAKMSTLIVPPGSAKEKLGINLDFFVGGEWQEGSHIIKRRIIDEAAPEGVTPSHDTSVIVAGIAANMFTVKNCYSVGR
jgi:hypothetical protein